MYHELKTYKVVWASAKWMVELNDLNYVFVFSTTQLMLTNTYSDTINVSNTYPIPYNSRDFEQLHANVKFNSIVVTGLEDAKWQH